MAAWSWAGGRRPALRRRARKPPRSAFLVRRVRKTTTAGRARSPAIGIVGAALPRVRHLRYLVAAFRHDFVRQDHAPGLVRAAGRRQRLEQAAEPAAVRRLRARRLDSWRQRSIVGRSRAGLLLVSESLST